MILDIMLCIIYVVYMYVVRIRNYPHVYLQVGICNKICFLESKFSQMPLPKKRYFYRLSYDYYHHHHHVMLNIAYLL